MTETERPATMEDMARAWPDKTPEELAAARAEIANAGGILTVVTTHPDEAGSVEGLSAPITPYERGIYAAGERAGYERAVAVLRDDERYLDWHARQPTEHLMRADPCCRREHLADYLAAVALPAPRVPVTNGPDHPIGAWVVPKIAHDPDAPVGPRLARSGTLISRSAGQSDPTHTRVYAAQLLAAADEMERRAALPEADHHAEACDCMAPLISEETPNA